MTRSLGAGVVAVVALAGVVAGPRPLAAAEPARPAASPVPLPASPAAPSAKDEVVATVGGEPITAGELEELAGPRLFQIRTQEYQARRQALDDTVGRRLVD